MKNRQFKEKNFWDKFAKNYDLFIEKTAKATYTSILANIELELDKSKKVLEIGTGTGIMSFSICSKVSFITATDISPEMIQLANDKKKRTQIQNIDFQVQDCYQLDLDNKSFDMVLASNIFHLFYEPERPLKEIKRVLNDDGILIAPTFCVGEDRKSSILAQLAGIFTGFKVQNKWNFRAYKAMFTDNGFEIEKEIRINGKFPLSYLVLKKDGRFLNQ